MKTPIRLGYLLDIWRMTGSIGFLGFVVSFLKLHRKFLLKRGRGLNELLPLNAPLNVQIDPSNACNFRCTFCPTGDTELLREVGRPVGMMTFELYKKLIDDMVDFSPAVEELHLYKDGEPLLNKHIIAMIAYARSRNVAKRIIMTSNCALLDEKHANAIPNSGLDVLRVSVEHVHDEGYKKVTKTFGNYQRIIDNVRFLYNEKRRRRVPLHIHSKIVDIGLTPSEKKKFYRDFNRISDSTALETIMGWSNPLGRDFMLGLDPQAGITGVAPRKRSRIVCPSPFYMLSVNWNGLVSVCCVDWAMDTIVGDASQQSLMQIWRGTKLRAFRLQHLEGNGHCLKACKNCQFVQGFLPSDDLDDHRSRLVPLFTAHLSNQPGETNAPTAAIE